VSEKRIKELIAEFRRKTGVADDITAGLRSLWEYVRDLDMAWLYTKRWWWVRGVNERLYKALALLDPYWEKTEKFMYVTDDTEKLKAALKLLEEALDFYSDWYKPVNDWMKLTVRIWIYEFILLGVIGLRRYLRGEIPLEF